MKTDSFIEGKGTHQ